MSSPESICPYCKHDFGKAVTQKRICPACKNTIVIRGGKPTTDIQARAIDAKREAEREAAYRRQVVQMRREHAASIRRDLRQFKAMGVRYVQISTANDDRTCPACRAEDNKLYSVDEALQDPKLPVKNCQSDYCRCVFMTVSQPKASSSPGCLICLAIVLVITACCLAWML